MQLLKEDIFWSKVGSTGKDLLPYLPPLDTWFDDDFTFDIPHISILVPYLSVSKIILILDLMKDTAEQLCSPDGEEISIRSLINLDQRLRNYCSPNGTKIL